VKLRIHLFPNLIQDKEYGAPGTVYGSNPKATTTQYIRQNNLGQNDFVINYFTPTV